MEAILTSNKRRLIGEYKELIQEELRITNSSNEFDYKEINKEYLNYIYSAIEEYIEIYCSSENNVKSFIEKIKENHSTFLPLYFTINNESGEEISVVNCEGYLKKKIQSEKMFKNLLEEYELLSILNSQKSALFKFPQYIKTDMDKKDEILKKINNAFIKKNENYLLDIYNEAEKRFKKIANFDWVTINHKNYDINIIFTNKKHIKIISGKCIVEPYGFNKKIERVIWRDIDFQIPYNIQKMESSESDDYYHVSIRNKNNETYNIVIKKTKDSYNYLNKMYSGM